MAVCRLRPQSPYVRTSHLLHTSVQSVYTSNYPGSLFSFYPSKFPSLFLSKLTLSVPKSTPFDSLSTKAVSFWFSQSKKILESLSSFYPSALHFLAALSSFYPNALHFLVALSSFYPNALLFCFPNQVPLIYSIQAKFHYSFKANSLYSLYISTFHLLSPPCSLGIFLLLFQPE